jgi:hypothetical protein
MLPRMRLWPLLVVLLPATGVAQPADCPRPPAEGPGLPLSLDLAGRPGVPAGTSGQAYLQIPVDPTGGYACEDAPPPSRDTLAGEPGDVLRGPRSPNLLRGPGRPRVEVETIPR